MEGEGRGRGRGGSKVLREMLCDWEWREGGREGGREEAQCRVGRLLEKRRRKGVKGPSPPPPPPDWRWRFVFRPDSLGPIV